MPEISEVRIMSDFINQYSDKRFIRVWNVERGNNPSLINFERQFSIISDSFGKELYLTLIGEESELKIWMFMGMNGSWKYVLTENWNETKYIRFRLDDDSGYSLILFGGFMGPKYSIGKPFTGTKRGPDPVREFNSFSENIIDNINKKAFDKPIYEVLLNQEYFNGIGNYLRSTILYYADVNPFEQARTSILNNPTILDLCYQIPIKSYNLNGGQLKDWKNPFDSDSKDFSEWVFYKKGISCKDSNNRTFWFDPKWKKDCPKIINQK